jgi:hypothetical protein
MDRRSILAATLVALSGCAGPRTDSGSPADASATPSTTQDTATGTTDRSTGDPSGTTDPTGTAADGLDLREANVTAVAVEQSSDGTDGRTDYRFDVTLYHDDAGEDGYADRWVVETLGGRELGRRELLHAHGTREFTRSTTVTVPGDVTCVVVRGHDQTHGYGGRAALVTPAAGATRAIDQGPDRQSLAGEQCP